MVTAPTPTGVPRLQATLAPLGSPKVTRHRGTVGSYGGEWFLMGEVPV